MADIPGLKLTLGEVSQTIDFGEVFDADLSANRDLKLAIGQAIIDRIRERTQDSKDVNGRTFAGYDEDYKDSDTFKAFGKTSKVDMTLTGNMLSQMDIVAEDSNAIKIGWDDETETKKAYNHNTGDTVTKRQFFGITVQELAQIQRDFASEIVKHSYAQDQERRTVMDLVAGLEEFTDNQPATRPGLLRRLWGSLFDDDD